MFPYAMHRKTTAGKRKPITRWFEMSLHMWFQLLLSSWSTRAANDAAGVSICTKQRGGGSRIFRDRIPPPFLLMAERACHGTGIGTQRDNIVCPLSGRDAPLVGLSKSRCIEQHWLYHGELLKCWESTDHIDICFLSLFAC